MGLTVEKSLTEEDIRLETWSKGHFDGQKTYPETGEEPRRETSHSKQFPLCPEGPVH